MNQEYELLRQLKKLWAIENDSSDSEALNLIKNFNKNAQLDIEAFEIQQKVLLKTREKTENLLERLKVLEQKNQ